MPRKIEYNFIEEDKRSLSLKGEKGLFDESSERVKHISKIVCFLFKLETHAKRALEGENNTKGIMCQGEIGMDFAKSEVEFKK